MRWIKDAKLEALLLKPYGIKFEIVTGIPMSEIDLEEGLKRQVRLAGKLDTDNVLHYGQLMEAPESVFHMCVLQKEKKRYWPWSGNHRLAAVDTLGTMQTVDAYVVEIHDPVMIDLFPRKVNLIEAVVGMNKEEQIVNAQLMVQKHGMTVTQAAKEFGLRVEQVYRSQRIEEAKDKISKLGVNTDDFTPTLLHKLHVIKNGVVLRRTAILLNKFKIRGKEAEQIVYEVAQSDSEAGSTVCLEKWESSLEARKSSKRSKVSNGITLPHREVNREHFFRLLTGMSRFLENNRTASKAQVTDPAHLEFVQKSWRLIKTGMSSLLGD